MKDQVRVVQEAGGEEEVEVGKNKKMNGFCCSRTREEEKAAAESDQSSSIGVQSSSSPTASTSSDGEESKGEEEAESKREEGGTFDSLEEALPIKRGLSSFFTGKSKSFTSLSDVANMNATDLAKPENSFNKRRRIVMARKGRSASYSSLVFSSLPRLSPPSPPDQISEEGDEEEIEEEQQDGGEST